MNQTGIKTEEATILICQCGNVNLELKKASVTAVILKCRDCGHDISVKGSVAVARINSTEKDHACEHAIHPVDKEKVEAEEKIENLFEKKVVLKFNVDESVRDMVYNGLELYRISNSQENGMDGNNWVQVAIEGIFAKYSAGEDIRALKILEFMKEKEEEAVAKFTNSKGKKLSKRKIKEIRDEAKATMMISFGLKDPNPVYVPPSLSESEINSREFYENAISDKCESLDNSLVLKKLEILTRDIISGEAEAYYSSLEVAKTNDVNAVSYRFINVTGLEMATKFVKKSNESGVFYDLITFRISDEQDLSINNISLIYLVCLRCENTFIDSVINSFQELSVEEKRCYSLSASTFR